jgi:hypothetical protein
MLFSDMHHGDHAGFDIPTILFGGAGAFKQGEYVSLPEDPASSRQSRDLCFTIMNYYFGLGVTSFRAAGKFRAFASEPLLRANRYQSDRSSRLPPR